MGNSTVFEVEDASLTILWFFEGRDHEIVDFGTSAMADPPRQPFWRPRRRYTCHWSELSEVVLTEKLRDQSDALEHRATPPPHSLDLACQIPDLVARALHFADLTTRAHHKQQSTINVALAPQIDQTPRSNNGYMDLS
jgi:hypothetical protein